MALPLVFVILVFVSIDGGGSISGADIFIPVWILCGILFCCCCFFLPCALVSSKQHFQEMFNEADQKTQQQTAQHQDQPTTQDPTQTQQQPQLQQQQQQQQQQQLPQTNAGNNQVPEPSDVD